MSRLSHQHRIGDEAEAQFAATILSEWVFRQEEKDYGVDGSVGIFTEKSAAYRKNLLCVLRTWKVQK